MRRYLLLFLSLMAGGSLLLVACSDDDASNGDVAMLVALDFLGGVEWHGIDEALHEEGAQIDATWLGDVTRARTAVAVIDWDDSLDDLVDTFLDTSAVLEEALAADDVEAAASAATPVHEAAHELIDSTYELLGERAGFAAPADDHDEAEE